LEYRGAIVDHVRHYVNRRFIPGNELAIVPDIFRLLDCHADSFSCDLRNEAESVLRHCGERGEKTQPALQNIIAEPKWNQPAPQHERGDSIGENVGTERKNVGTAVLGCPAAQDSAAPWSHTE